MEYTLQSEYRRDALDYEDTESEFYREKIRIFFSRESEFNFAFVYIDKISEKRYTWNLVLNDVLPSSTFLLGYYYVHYGCGLITGIRSAYNHDIFYSQGGIMVQGKPFVPCLSGNPFYAFNGISASHKVDVSDISISLSMFYSIKNRYINQNSYESKTANANTSTIDYNYSGDYPDIEPVMIHTNGANLSIGINRLFSVQLYYLFTCLNSSNGKSIIFDYEKEKDTGTGYGTKNFFGSGLFLEYKDDYIRLFVENAFSIRDDISDNGGKRKIYGYGIISGINLNHPLIMISLVGKNVNSRFYSSYSSSIGSDLPERGYFFDLAIKPYSNIKFGTALSSEKKNTVNYRDDEPPYIIRERLYADYSYGMIKDINFTCNILKKEELGINDKRFQLKSALQLEIINNLTIDLSNIYQNGNNVASSKMYLSGLCVKLFSCLENSIFYAKAYISSENTIYSTMLPLHYSNVPGFYIKADSDIIAWKSVFIYKGIYLSARYLHQIFRDKSTNRILELFASGYF